MSKKHFTSAYVSIAAILLSCLGAISVGFSTWIISQGDSASASGNINADSINSMEGITVAANCFTMGHYHYENSNITSSNPGYYVENGNLIYTLTINPATVRNKATLATTNTLKISTTTTFSKDKANLAIFKDAYLSSISYKKDSETETNLGSGTGVLQYNLVSPYESVSYYFNVDVSGNDTIVIVLTYKFTQQLVARYYEEMIGGSFYLALEGD